MHIEIYKELLRKNKKSRNQARERLEKALTNRQCRPKRNKKRMQTGISSKMNHLQNLAMSSEPFDDGDDEEEEDEE